MGLTSPGGEVSEVTLHQSSRHPGIEITRNRQTGVGGDVVAPVKRVGVLQGGGVQILHETDDRPVIGMRARVGGRLQIDAGQAVGTVLVALPALVLHHVSLDVQPTLVEGIQQETHAVRLQPQR